MTDMAATGSQREVELKLAIASESARTTAGREVGRAPARSVETIYFDTPKRRLKSAGYTLRLRRDGEQWSQSVKASDAGLSRFEQDHPLRGGVPDFSLLEGTPIASLVGPQDHLAAIFVTRVQRQSRRRAQNGSRIELSLDDGEVIAQNRSWPILELELELKAGEPEALFDHGRRLAGDDAFVPGFMSKAERGYALADGILGEPVKFGAYALDANMPSSAAFRALARRCLRQISLNAELVARGARLEALHQARTALRRLRVAVGVFKPLLEPGRVQAIKAELEWLTAELADARNLDVFMFETFRPSAEAVADRQAAAAFGRALMKSHDRAHERARAALSSSRFRLLLLDAAHWIEGELEPTLGEGVDDPRTADFAARALAKRRHALRRRLEALDWKDPFARHKARISAKKMRYASEFFLDMGPGSRSDRYRPFVKALAALQDDLGRLNDFTVAEPMLPTILQAAPSEAVEAERVGYAAGLIMGRDLAKAAKLGKSAQRASRAFLDKPIWW